MLLLVTSAHCQLSSTGDNTLSFYVSADKGNDAHPGSEDLPFKTFAKAVSLLAPGCNLYVMDGTYYERLSPPSGTQSKPIRVAAYKGHSPTINGAHLLQANWSIYKGHIYSTPYDGRVFNQLFVDGKMMTTARWPNAHKDPDKVFDMERAVTTAGNQTSISDPQLPDGDWSAGKLYIWPGAAWISFVKDIKDYEPRNGLTVTEPFIVAYPHAEDKPYCLKKGNHYFLFGKLAGLDAPNEWVIEQSTLYLYAPDAKSPAAAQIEYRVREYGINLKDKSHVQVSGISLFAAAIMMQNSTNCVIDRCNQKYHEHFEDTSGYGATFMHHLNYVSGRNNVWKNSELAYAAGDGIRLDGSSNVISNMLIHDVDYSGGWFAGVTGQPGKNKDNVPDAADTNPTIISTCNNATVTHCTIYNPD